MYVLFLGGGSRWESLSITPNSVPSSSLVLFITLVNKPKKEMISSPCYQPRQSFPWPIITYSDTPVAQLCSWIGFSLTQQGHRPGGCAAMNQPHLLKVPALCVDSRSPLGTVLQNHLLMPNVKAQVLGASNPDLLPAGVLQVLGRGDGC